MMKFKYIALSFCLFLLNPWSGFSQEQPTLLDRAKEQFYHYNYAQVVQFLEARANSKNATREDLYLVAESYFQMRDFENASLWYAKITANKDCEAKDAFQYATALKALGKYQEAKKWFQEFINKGGAADQAAIHIAGCDSALIWEPNPAPYTMENLSRLNTENAEITINKLGENYYLAAERTEPNSGVNLERYGWTGKPYIKVFELDQLPESRQGNLTLKNPPINTSEYHVGPVASPDFGNTLYVTRTFVGKGLIQRDGGKKTRTQRLEIFIYKKDEAGAWSEPVPFAYNDPDQYSVGHAAFSLDGKIMYFVSDRPGGLGGTDIWYCELGVDGQWGAPKNAGTTINSAGNELFPTIGLQGEMYFSSDGQIGLGGLDIYHTTGALNNWADPQNLKSPLNSSYDDFAYHIINDNEEVLEAFLASNRPGGKGSDDLYRILYHKPKPAPEPIVLLVQGKVLHQTTKEPISNAAIEVQVGPSQPTLKLFTNNQGAFEFSADTALNYQIRASKTTFISDINLVTTVNITKSDTLYTELLLEPEYTVGKTFVLENLYYDYDKHHIRPDAALVLDGLAQILTENPTMKIELSSHTDSRGNDAYNLNLSQRRANAAVQYLIQKGIAKDRLVAKGYGETQLVNDCANGVKCTEEQHQANRRTEVKVLAM